VSRSSRPIAHSFSAATRTAAVGPSPDESAAEDKTHGGGGGASGLGRRRVAAPKACRSSVSGMGTSGASTAANSSTAAAAGSTARTCASESSIELGAVAILGGTVTIFSRDGSRPQDQFAPPLREERWHRESPHLEESTPLPASLGEHPFTNFHGDRLCLKFCDGDVCLKKMCTTMLLAAAAAWRNCTTDLCFVCSACLAVCGCEEGRRLPLLTA